MMRFLATVVASAISAEAAFYHLLEFTRAYALRDGAVIGAVLFGLVWLAEVAVESQLPAWVLVPAIALVTGCFYWFFMVAMLGV